MILFNLQPIKFTLNILTVNLHITIICIYYALLQNKYFVSPLIMENEEMTILVMDLALVLKFPIPILIRLNPSLWNQTVLKHNTSKIRFNIYICCQRSASSSPTPVKTKLWKSPHSFRNYENPFLTDFL